MYKSPELSSRAKLLCTELAAKGIRLGHAQALELVSKLEGARNLHVAQAQSVAARPAEQALALEHAERLMFTSLGRYAGRSQALMQDIRAAFALEYSREVEAAVADIFETEGAPVVQPHVDEFYAIERLPELFERFVAESLALVLRLRTTSPAERKPGAQQVLFQGPVRDWRLEEGADPRELDAEAQRSWQASVKRSGSQFYVDIAPPHAVPDDIEHADQMSLFVEVNDGVPCVHITNDCYGDQVLTVYATRDGLYLRPDDSRYHITTGVPEGDALQRLEAVHRAAGSTMTNAFVCTPR